MAVIDEPCCNRRLEAKWCLDCPKCAFVFLMMSAFIDEPQVTEVFGMDRLASDKHVPAFLDLCGHGGHKPLECVGQADECLLALHLASKRRSAKPLHPDLAAILPSDEQAKALHDQVLGVYNDENGLPPEWNEQLRPLVCPEGR